MSDRGAAFTLYVKHTDKLGGAHYATYTARNPQLFMQARVAEASLEGGKAKAEQVTKDQYLKHR